MSINDCERELARLIHVIVEYGGYTENARIDLAKNPNFSPFLAFRRINRSATGFLTPDELDEFLRQNGLVLNADVLLHFFTQEKDKSYRMTYNDFLNQVLPLTDIDLRNACLERPHRQIENFESNLAEVDQLIAAVYHKGNDYTRTIEGGKTKLLTFSNPLLERVFQSLADDVTGNLSFKSISNFMKHNEYNFTKKEYESFMSKIDKNLTGRITPIDFKFQLFPRGFLSHNREDMTHRKAESIFSGISPIKNWNSSPNKGSSRKPYEASVIGENERSLLAMKNKSNVQSPNDKFPREQDRKTHGSTFNPSAMKSQKQSAIKQPNEGFTSSKTVLYNQQIAAVNEQMMLQNAPEANYYDKNSKNPLEWRYLDPVYHNYWSYHRDHNRTLSPDYFNRAESHTIAHKHHHSLRSGTGTNSVPFFNPTFVDPGTYENFERYPDNPFRYTDHGHFFKNYYASLRHNYYEQYYNYIPYKVKVSSEVNSRNSPQKQRAQSQRNSPSPQRQQQDAYPPANYEYNDQPSRHTTRKNLDVITENTIPSYPRPSAKAQPARKTRDNLEEGFGQPQQTTSAPYQYVFVEPQGPQENEVRSAIKIEQQPFSTSSRMNQNFNMERPGGKALDEFSNKPYTFVVMNK